MTLPLSFFIERNRVGASAPRDTAQIDMCIDQLGMVPPDKLLVLRRWLLIELQDLRNADLLAPLVRHSSHVSPQQCRRDSKTRSC